MSTICPHSPPDYICPFCLVVEGIENKHVATKQDDIVYQDDEVTAFISCRWWANNSGHVLVIPNEHIENVYSMSTHLLGKVQEVARQISLGLKETYKCDGVSSRQHNEPAGNQDVWHYHLHVFPRYKADRLYLESGSHATPAERLPYAQKLRTWLDRRNF
jgi:histidine triad (HIT) family protein